MDMSNGRRRPISQTLVLNLAGIGVVAVLALILVLTATIRQSFSELEDREIAAHQARLESFKATRLKEVEARAKDWAIWNDTYNYTQDFGAGYREENINPQSFDNLLIDAMLVYRYADGRYSSDAYDRTTGEHRPALEKELAALATAPEFVAKVRAESSFGAFVNVQGRIYALCAIRIALSDGGGHSPGFMVFLTEIGSRRASEALQADVQIVPGGGFRQPEVRKAGEKIQILDPLLDEWGRAAGYLDMKLPRPLVPAAERLVLLVLAGTVGVVLALLIALQLRVRQLVLGPVERLHAHLNAVRSSGELRTIAGPARDDELGAVQDEFNRMTRELEDMRIQLESQSFALGKTQSAIGLMHNLRNCLSPVRVILETLERQVGKPLPPQAGRALRELQADGLAPDRREKLVQFLAAAHDDISARDAGNQHAVREAARNLMNAFSAIDDVQAKKGETPSDERCELPTILSHSCNVARFVEDLDIATKVDADPDAIVSGNRILISQVVENLVANAVEAIRQTGRGSGAIALHAGIDRERGECCVTVSDDGTGFDPATAQRLFERGYSTRASGSGGLGLHWCANTIKAMGGELSLASEGPGTGATARITLALWKDAAGRKPLAA